MDNFLLMTDEELVASYAQGNNNAFDELLSRHQQALYTYISFSIGSSDMVEDIFQDTFIKAITTLKKGKYTETGKFKAWIFRIAHNLMMDYFRKEKNENTISNDACEFDLLNNLGLCEDTVEAEMVKSQILDDVKKLVCLLPPSQREVLEMRYYRDLSFKEIADKTGVSINTALGRMRYAILNMRKMAEDNRMVLSMS